MKDTIKNKTAVKPLIALIASGGLYLIYFAVFGFYPFGERSIAWCDMEQQYVPILMELRNALKGDGSILLGQGGAGLNFWGVFLFFVSSPVGFLSVFVSQAEMLHFVNILTIIKLALSACAAELFFTKMFTRLSGILSVPLAVMYSFSGYVMMYYQNNMWLDMMILFPILLISLIRLAEDGKWVGSAVCLSLSMYLNFYISFMIILFSVIFFALLLKHCCKPENRGLHAFRFILADVCAAFISAIVWLPVLKQMSHSARSGSTLNIFCAKGLFGDLEDKSALLACTGIVFTSLILMLLFRKAFRSGRNACYAAMSIILTISALLSPVNMLWHTGSYQAYPLRYGFMLIFMCLCMAAALLSHNDEIRTKLTRGNAASLIIAVFCALTAAAVGLHFRKELGSYAGTLWTDENDSAVLTAIGLIFAIAYLLLIVRTREKALPRRLTAFAMTLLMLGESALSFGIYFDNVNDITERFDYTQQLAEEIDDEEFYRLKSADFYYYSNMPEGMGVPSLGHYTSLTDGGWLFGAKRLGYSAYWMDISSCGGTAVTDAFLMNKYVSGISPDLSDLYEPYSNNGIIKVFRNRIISDGAVISDTDPKDTKQASELQRIESSAFIAEKLYHADDIFSEINYTCIENASVSHDGTAVLIDIIDEQKPASITYEVTVSGTRELYFDIFGNYSTRLSEDYFDAADVYANGILIASSYPTKRRNGILDLGTFTDTTVTVKIEPKKDFTAESFGVFALDTAALSENVEKTPTAKISVKGNKLSFKADGKNGSWMYIPFACNSGFSARVNGKKAPIERAFGEFSAVKLTDGENNIVLTFVPEGFAAGALLTVIGVILLTALAITAKKHRLNRKILRFSELAVSFTGLALPFIMGIGGLLLWMILQF